MTTKTMVIAVPGQPVQPAVPLHGGVQIERRVITRSAATSTKQVATDDLIELEWEDGLVEVKRADELRDVSRDGGGALAIPLRRGDGRQRGGVPLDALNIVSLDDEWIRELIRKVAGEAVEGAIERVIAELVRAGGEVFPSLLRKLEELTSLRDAAEDGEEPEGLFLMSRGGVAQRLAASTRKDWKRVLVLVHGTFSSIEGGFRHLFNAPEWLRLLAHYEREPRGAVLAYQHYTVGRSPTENAVDLARRLAALLAPGTHVDIVSHSRGGLVAECLLPPREPEAWLAFLGELQASGGKGRLPAADIERLRETALIMSELRVERFVRVACPILGTSLMGERVDRFASAIFTVAKLLGAGTSPFFIAAKLIIRFLLKVRQNPLIVPGLAAMAPESGLIGALNYPDRASDVQLAEHAANTLGRGILRRLTVGGARVLFGGDNDLVVDTENMFGGARPAQRWVSRTDSAELDHFTYFENATSRIAVERFLTGDPTLLQRAVEPGAARGDRGAFVKSQQAVKAPKPRGDRPRLLLVPGIMGSRLEVERADHAPDLVWFSAVAIAGGKFGLLEHDLCEVRPEGLVEASYGRFVRYMSQWFDVHLFPYDWRVSVYVTGSLLAARIDELLASKQPLHVVAHSMGGLVLRAALTHHPVLDDRVRKGGGRFLMAGTPNGGSHELLHMVAEENDSVLNMLALLDLTRDRGEVATIARGFPGVLEMLPWNEPSSWQASGPAWRPNAQPNAANLVNARATQDWLLGAPTQGYPKQLIYLAGTAKETLSGRDSKNGNYLTTKDGDGRVTYATGIPPARVGLTVQYVDAVHGSLLDDPASFPAVRELLETGATARLSTRKIEPSASAHGAGWRTTEPPRRPTPDEVLDILLCRGAEREVPVAMSTVRVQVVADSLHWAKHALMIGHYAGDSIVGTEELVDELLDGALSRHCKLGRYAGALDRNTVVLRPKSRPAGAVVVGLGRLGELTELSLRRAVRGAAVEYALAAAMSVRGDRSDLGLSSLLLGSRGALPAGAAVRAILLGVLDANRELEAAGEAARIGHIELIELFEPLARIAHRELDRLQSSVARGAIDLQPRIRVGEAARSLAIGSAEPNGWVRRVLIEDDAENERMMVRALTERSRATTSIESRSWDLIRPLVEAARSSTRSLTHATGTPLGWLLYSLVPEVFSTLQDGLPVQLVLDARAASIPWEIIEASPDGSAPPVVTQVELTRQLLLDTPLAPRDADGDRVVIMADLEHGTPYALSGAAEEARAIADMFGERASTRFVQPAHIDLIDVLDELFCAPISILHIAAHGDLDDPAPGQVKRGRRPYIRLGADHRLDATVLGKLRFAPRIVFLNCCHLANLDGPYFASSIARQFIESGSRVVIAAGWAIDDDAAQTFAITLYRGLLAGLALGAATKEARAVTHAEHPGSNTFGAFQVYGDPGFRLRNRVVARTNAPRWPDPTTSMEVVERLDVLRSELVTSGDSTEISADLEHVERQWRELAGDDLDGSILQRLGELHLRLLDPQRALVLFEEAADDPKRRASQTLPERILDAHTRRLRIELSQLVPPTEARRRQLLEDAEAAMRAVTGGAEEGEATAEASASEAEGARPAADASHVRGPRESSPAQAVAAAPPTGRIADTDQIPTVGGAADAGGTSTRQSSAKQDEPPPKLTAERHALLGSAHKEMAWIAFDPAEVGKHLHLSYRHYRDAYRADKKKPPYPAQIMALLARAALARGLTAVESPAELASHLQWIRAKAQTDDDAAPDYWNVAAHATTHLASHLDHLLRRDDYDHLTPHATLECVLEWYAHAYAAQPTPYHWHSELSLARWLRDMIARGGGDADARASLDAVVAHLEDLQSKIARPLRERPAHLHERTDWIRERPAHAAAAHEAYLAGKFTPPSEPEYEPPDNPFPSTNERPT